MTDGNKIVSGSPGETFLVGRKLGEVLSGGEVVLLTGPLGAGKTLLTKGILEALDFDVDEVTSPSFTLVNLYKTTRFDVYHIDLWRSDAGAAAFSVGLDEILEDESNVVIVEWADRLGRIDFEGRTVVRVSIEGDGDEPRDVTIKRGEHVPATGV